MDNRSLGGMDKRQVSLGLMGRAANEEAEELLDRDEE
jgi:hypothetical protein